MCFDRTPRGPGCHDCFLALELVDVAGPPRRSLTVVRRWIWGEGCATGRVSARGYGLAGDRCAPCGTGPVLDRSRRSWTGPDAVPVAVPDGVRYAAARYRRIGSAYRYRSGAGTAVGTGGPDAVPATRSAGHRTVEDPAAGATPRSSLRPAVAGGGPSGTTHRPPAGRPPRGRSTGAVRADLTPPARPAAVRPWLGSSSPTSPTRRG